jgi:RNA polymerase sigma-70 factor (sigma-E family)
VEAGTPSLVWSTGADLGDLEVHGNRTTARGFEWARRWTMATTEDLDELYAASYRRLVVQLFAVCGDLPTAEDAVQDAFVTALRKRRELTSIANPEAWVRTVALNRLRSGWRHAAVAFRHRGDLPGPQCSVEVGPEHVALVRALAALDADQRVVVVLHHLADLGTAQIATELGVPEGTVKSRLSRARARLTLLLEEREDVQEVRHV